MAKKTPKISAGFGVYTPTFQKKVNTAVAKSNQVYQSGKPAGGAANANTNYVQQQQQASKARTSKPTGLGGRGQALGSAQQDPDKEQAASTHALQSSLRSSLKYLSSTDSAGAPQNAGQWVMNLLSTGDYAVGNMLRSTQNTGQTTPTLKKVNGKWAIQGKQKTFGQNLSDAGQEVKAGAQGLGEGIGMRYDKDGNGKPDKPTMPGDDLLATGKFDNLPKPVQTGIAFAGDVAGDPTNLVDLGIGAGIKGAIKGGAAATRAAREAGVAATAGDVAKGIAGGAANAVRLHRAEKVAGRAIALGNRGKRAAYKVEQRAIAKKGAVAPVAAEDAVRAPEASEAVNAATAPEALQPVAKAAEAAPVVPRVGEKAAIDALLPKLKGSVKEDVEVPAAKILSDAAQPTGAPLITADHAAQIDDITHAANVKDIESGLSSLKKDKSIAPVLKKTVKIPGEQPLTVGDLIHKVAMRRITGSVAAEDPRLLKLQDALNNTLSAAQHVPAKTTPQSLADSITANLPSAKLPSTPEDLFNQLAQTPAGSREALLKDVLAATKKTTVSYDDFGQAIDAGARGEMGIGTMRRMLTALGQDTKQMQDLKAPELSSLLADKGRKSYQDIVDSLETPTEIDNAHNITPEIAAEAKQVDVAAVTDKAATDSQKEIEQLGYDPTIPHPADFGSVTGAAMGSAVRELGDLFKRGNATDAFDNNAWRALWSKTTQTVSRRAPRAVQGENDVLRQTFVRSNVLDAARLTEHYYRGLGIHPRIMDDRPDIGGPLYVGISQVMDELRPDTLDKLIFPLGIVMKGTVRGITMHPTTLGNALRLAVHLRAGGMDATDAAEDVSRWLADEQGIKGASAFLATQQGREAMDQFIDDLATTDLVDRISRLHDEQAPIAAAASHAAADDIVATSAGKIIAAVNRGAERGELNDILNQAWKESASAARSASENVPSLVSDSVRQQMNNGVIQGILGEDGKTIIESDARAAGRLADTAKRLAEKQAKVVERRARGKSLKVNKKADTEFTNQAAKDGIKDLNDNDAGAQALADDEIEQGIVDPDDDLASIETYAEYLAQAGPWSKVGLTLGHALDGSFGMGEQMKTMLAAQEDASKVASAQYSHDLQVWLRGGEHGREGVDIRLQRDLHAKGKLTYPQMNGYIDSWWRALASQPDGIEYGQIAANLSHAGLSDAQASMAIELKQIIDGVFDPSVAGAFSRSGLTSTDLLKQMRNYGMGADKRFDAYLPSVGERLADQSQIWRNFLDAPDKLELLQRYKQAVGAATVKPVVAQQLSKFFDHRASDMTVAEARAAGWKKLATTDENADLARYVDPDSYFPPEIIQRLTFLQKVMTESASFSPGLAKQISGTYDMILNVFKQSATIFRPGHHVTNILGDMMTNVLAGVSPVQYIRSLKMIRANGHLMDADLGPLAHFNTTMKDAGMPLPDKFNGDTVLVNIKGQITPVDMDTLVRSAHTNGVAMTHNTSRDLTETLGEQINPTGFKKFLASKANVLGRTSEALGQFSAVRDNVTRFAHYIDALEKGQFSSLDAAFSGAASTVHKWHPTVSGLSTFEKKYARRIFYFYTWARQMAALVVRTALDKPGLVTIPSKLQYEQAETNGLNPESIGQIYNGDPRMASYNQTSLLGPSFLAGGTPWQQTSSAQLDANALKAAGLTQYGSMQDALTAGQDGQMSAADMTKLLTALGLQPSSGNYKQTSTMLAHLKADGDAALASSATQPNLWGYSLSSPQIDTLTTLFGGATGHAEDNPWDNGVSMVKGFANQTILGSMSPTITEIPSLIQGQQVGAPPGTGAITDGGKYLFDQTGIPASLARSIPGQNGSLYNTLFPNTSAVKYETPAELDNDRQRSLLNFLSGLKYTNYTSSASTAVAKSERQALAQKLKAQGKTPAATAGSKPTESASDVAAQAAVDKQFAASQAKATEEQAEYDRQKNWPAKILHDSGLMGRYKSAQEAAAAGEAGQLSDEEMEKLLKAMGESYNYKRTATLEKHLRLYAPTAIATPGYDYVHGITPKKR